MTSSMQSTYGETHRRIAGLTDTLTHLETEGQITIHATSDFAHHDPAIYDSPAEYLAWFSYGHIGSAVSESHLPKVYLFGGVTAFLVAIYIFAFGPRTPKPPTE